jgi:microcystin-dependent protein
MADARISQLPAATTVESADIVPFTSISASETRKITANNLGIALTSLGLSVGTNVPSSPYNGQLWVDTSTNPPVLKVYNGASFTTVSFLPGSSVATSPSGTAPTSPVLGQLWLDTSQTPDELKVYDGAAFVRVDPLGITDAAATAKYLQITNANSTFLALTGGTMTGDLTLNGDPSTNNMASNKKYVDDQIAAIPAATDLTPAGTVIYTARSTAPTGYLKANGAAVSRTTFSALFAAIGEDYGAGDGSTTFNVPDLRGEFLRGLDDSRGVDSGRTLGSAQGSQNLAHSHTASANSSVNDPGHNHTFASNNSDSGDGNTLNDRSNQPNTRTMTTSSETTGISVSTTVTVNSGGGGTEARPRNIALLACIKT